jgi:hypothetical protein
MSRPPEVVPGKIVRYTMSLVRHAENLLVVRVVGRKLGQLANVLNLLADGLFDLLQESRVCKIG